jgi:alginate O-acetyltransferase complex protein AlgI
MSVTSLEFLVALFFGSALFAPLSALWMRRSFITLCSIVFLWLQAPNAVNLLTLIAFVLSGYAAGEILVRRPSKWLLAGYLLALTAAFVILKRYAFLQLIAADSLLTHAIDLVGLSFIFFRQIHYVVDVKQGDIKETSLWSYLIYQLNPFTLLAGPIQRFQRFHEDWQKLEPLPADKHELRKTFLRILIGVLKVALLGELCLRLAMQPPEGPIPWQVYLFYFFPAYVYFNFAGYCDIVIGAAALVGIRVPENFDKPYLARNMIDFWTRWHRTLSFWIRDYVFTPMYMAIARRRPGWAPHLVFVCYFVALFLAGVWHGATWNFVVFGVLNGAGVAAAKLWENVIVAHRGRPGLRAYLANRPIRIAAGVATIHFVCLTQIFLRPGTEDNVVSLYQMIVGLFS